MKALKRHYHWIIALVVFVEMIVYGGFLNAGSVFIVPITDSLGLSRGDYSMALVPRGIVAFFSTMVTGFLFHKLGYRKSAIISLVSFAAGLVLLAYSQSLMMITISNALLGLSYGVCTTAGAVRIMKSWFHKHQGLMLGVVTMATGVGGSIMSMTLTEIILASNWRYAYIFTALLTSVLAILYLLLRDKPEEMGLRPYGEDAASGKKQTADVSHTEWMGHTLQEILKEPQFYLMAFCTFLSCNNVYLTFNVVVPHFQDGGYTATEAAAFSSVLLLCLSAVKLAGGWLCDRIGAKSVTILCAACAAAGQFLLADVSNPILCYIGIVLFAMGLLSTTITVPMLAMPLFGYRAFGSITGIFLSMVSLASMLAGPIVNLFYDLLGSYSPVFRVAALIDLLLIGLYLLLFYLCEKEKKHFLAAGELL